MPTDGEVIVRRPSARTSSPVRVLVVLAGILVALGVVAATGVVLLRSVGLSAPDAAIDAAVAQLRATSGAQRVDVIAAVGWSDCSVVSLHAPDLDLGVSMAMVKDVGGWRLGRQSSEQAYFDTDDVIGSRQTCLDIARSDGPLPDEESSADDDVLRDMPSAGN